MEAVPAGPSAPRAGDAPRAPDCRRCGWRRPGRAPGSSLRAGHRRRSVLGGQCDRCQQPYGVSLDRAATTAPRWRDCVTRTGRCRIETGRSAALGALWRTRSLGEGPADEREEDVAERHARGLADAELRPVDETEV